MAPAVRRDFNHELGEYGSLMFFGGGHVTWGGCTVIRFDIATGMWSQMGDTIYANTESSLSMARSRRNRQRHRQL